MPKHRIFATKFAGVYPLMQKIYYLDKLIDKLAKRKAMEKILRQ